MTGGLRKAVFFVLLLGGLRVRSQGSHEGLKLQRGSGEGGVDVAASRPRLFIPPLRSHDSL